MSIINYAVSATSTESLLVPKANAQPPRVLLIIQNNHSAAVFLGPTGVSTSDGYTLAANTELTIEPKGPNGSFYNRDAIYVIASNDDGADVRAFDFRETR